jgi:molecular chaperone HscB
VNLTDDDFALFQLPVQFDIDSKSLERARQALQLRCHPDRFVGQGASAQRLAMQWSVRINEAYARLRAPLERAIYLCQLAGYDPRQTAQAALPPELLMQHMQWREQLDDAHGQAQALLALHNEVQQEQTQRWQAVAAALNQQPVQAKEAAQHLQALMFIEKLMAEIAQHQEATA